MNRIEVITSAELKGDGEKLSPKEGLDALEIVKSYATTFFGGLTWTWNKGTWTTPEGKMVSENGMSFLILTKADEYEGKVFAEVVRNAFQQKEVVFFFSKVEGAFVGSEIASKESTPSQLASVPPEPVDTDEATTLDVLCGSPSFSQACQTDHISPTSFDTLSPISFERGESK